MQTLMRGLVVVVGLGLCGPGLAARIEPRDYATLLRQLPKQTSRRIERLRAFADDERMRVSDRLRAVRHLLDLLDEDDPERPAALLKRAALFGVAHARRERARALREAAALSDPEQRALINTVIELDATVRRMEEITERRMRQADDTAMNPDEAAMQVRVQEGAEAYDLLGDDYGGTRVRLALARLKEATGADREDVLAAYTPLVRAGGNARDTAAFRREVRLSRSRVLFDLGRRREAVKESLIADRMTVVPPTRPAFDAVERTPYDKSRETEELCRKVRPFGVRCDEVQREIMDDVVYYDYTRDTPRTALGPEVMQQVFDEYGGLLNDCAGVAPAGVERVRLEWRVAEDGMARDMVVRPAVEGAFSSCLQDALKRFRYPRSRSGDTHFHVSLSLL